jgi:fatty acid desaturase
MRLGMPTATEKQMHPFNRNFDQPSTELSPTQLADLTAELEAIRHRVYKELGDTDASYIRRIALVKQLTEIGGRALLFAGALPQAWGTGVTLLSISKMLDNMTIGHNVIHGQYDWMNDPILNSQYKWNMNCPEDLWKRAHNQTHHTFTGILGKDRDIGYGLLRVSDEQPWNIGCIFQPISALILMLSFEWGISLYTVELEKGLRGENSLRSLISKGKRFVQKASQQSFKDYLGYPLLAGPFAPFVFTGNLTANVMRNIVSFGAIFCGHFPEGVQVQQSSQENESKGARYLRQIRGSANFTAPRWFHALTGHLGYQIEHHLFPTLPANRYEEIASEVEEICRKYGITYNSRPFLKQIKSVAQRICQLSLPTQRQSHTHR